MKNNNHGFMDVDFTGTFVAFALISAVVGWAVIELMLWLASFAWDWLVAYAAAKGGQP